MSRMRLNKENLKIIRGADIISLFEICYNLWINFLEVEAPNTSEKLGRLCLHHLSIAQCFLHLFLGLSLCFQVQDWLLFALHFGSHRWNLLPTILCLEIELVKEWVAKNEQSFLWGKSLQLKGMDIKKFWCSHIEVIETARRRLMGQKFGIWEFRSQKYLKYPYLPLFINVTRSKLSKFCMFLSLLAKYLRNIKI